MPFIITKIVVKIMLHQLWKKMVANRIQTKIMKMVEEQT